MSNYTKATNFTAKDSLTSGNPAKVVKGSEIDTEFTAIQTAVNSKADLISATLVTPNLGTPSAGVLTNATGLPISTGVSGLATGVATLLGTPTSANLAAAITDETGSGALVFATSPTLVTPALGTPSALVGTNITGTASGLTAGNVTTNANLTGHVTSVGNAAVLGSFTSAQLATALTDETGSGAAVFATSPTLITPALGTPSAIVLTNATGLPPSGVTGTALVAAAIGTTVQAYDADLTTWAGVTPGTGIATALAVNVGSAGAPVLFNGALGTPSSGTVTNLTGTASININGTVGATTPGTGAFTTLSASGIATLSVISSSTGLTTGVAAGFITAFNVAGTELARLSGDTNGVFTVGKQNSVAAFGGDYGTLGACGINGGGLRVYVGAGAGTATSYLLGDATGTTLMSQPNLPVVVGVNNAEVSRHTSTGLAVTGVVTPEADNTRTLGTGALRWSTVYAGTGTISTSDAREKTPVTPLSAAHKAAAVELRAEIGTYQWLSAIASKGESARKHIGMTVQRAIEIMESHDLDLFGYGFICYDSWDAETKEVVCADGEFSREITRQVTETVESVTTEIQIIDGIPTQAQKATTQQVPQFEQVAVVDSNGDAVMVIDQAAKPEVLDGDGNVIEPAVAETYRPLTHPVPVMETATERYNIETVREAGDRYSFRMDELLLFMMAGLPA